MHSVLLQDVVVESCGQIAEGEDDGMTQEGETYPLYSDDSDLNFTDVSV